MTDNIAQRKSLSKKNFTTENSLKIGIKFCTTCSVGGDLLLVKVLSL